MSARKSLPGGSSRYSRFSIQSQLSGVLNSDSNVISDDEGNPLWHKDFGSNSINQSARFSAAQNDTPILDPNSEPESTPLEKNWWKNVENTPYVRFSRSKVSGERTSVQERSVVDSSDTSSLGEDVRKQRLPFRRSKRKSLGRNVFSEILDTSKDSITAENIGGNKSNDQKQDSIVSQSDTDISIEKIRKQPFKTKRKHRLVKQPFNVESNSDESVPDEFQDALDGSQLPNENEHQAEATNEPSSFLGNREAKIPGPQDNTETVTRQLEHASPEKLSIAADESAGVSIQDDDLERSRSPMIVSRTKTRMIFAKRSKRKTMNFDDLLNDASASEHVADQSSIRGELGMNRNEKSKGSVTQSLQESDFPSHILTQEDESDSEESIIRERVPFTYKKRKTQQEKSFTQLLTSPNTSVRSEPVNFDNRPVEIDSPIQKIPWSDIDRQSSKRRSNFTEGNKSTRKLSHSSSSANKSGNLRRSMRQRNDQTEISDHSDVELEDNQLVNTQARPSSVGNKSGTDRRSTNKKNDHAEISDPLIVELQEDRAVSIPIRPLSSGDKSGAERRSMNRTKESLEASSSSNVEYFIKLRTPNRNRISSNDSPVNKNRLSTQEKNDSREVHDKYTNEELPVSTDEEEDEEEDFPNNENLQNSASIIEPKNQTQKNREYLNDSRSTARDANSINMKTTILMDSATRSADRKKKASTKKTGSMSVENLEKSSSALRENNREVERERTRSFVADRLENTEIDESEVTGVGTQRSFSSPRQDDGTGSIQADASSRIESRSFDTDKQSQLRIALEEVKKNELVHLKNTQIDSYFKKVSAKKSDAVAVAKEPQKLPKKTKPVGNQNKTPPNKAYLVNGKVYKRPKLPRPKSWATDRLYNFLWKKLEPKYKLRTRVRSEKFILYLSHAVALIVRRQKYDNYKAEMEDLIHEMARLEIIKTKNEFHIFCRDFLPYEFRIKVIPMLLPGNVRNIPFNPNELHTPILEL